MLPSMMWRRTFQQCSWCGASMGGGPAGWPVGKPWTGWDVGYLGFFGHAVCEPRCDHDDCEETVVYSDEHRSLCDDHYTTALEWQGGACDGR